MRYEDSMKGVAAQIIKEQQRASKIKNNPEEFHWHDEYATLNFFRFICKNIGNLGNGEIEKMVTRLKSIDQKAVENHVNGAVWAFDYDKMFCVLMENEICRKVCEKNKYNSWMKIIYVFLTIFLYLLKCPQSLILSALRAFCFCGKPHISRSIFLYFRYQAWLKSW